MDYRIFNVCTDVNASDCTWGCTDTITESALKFDSGRKILCCNGESNLRRLPARQMLYQLSYIPTPFSAPSHPFHTSYYFPASKASFAFFL